MNRPLRVILAALLICCAVPVAVPSSARATTSTSEFAYVIPQGTILSDYLDSGYTQTVAAYDPDPDQPNLVHLANFGVGHFSDIKIEGPDATPVTAGTTYDDARTLDDAVPGKATFHAGHHAFDCEDVRTTFTVHDIAYDEVGRISMLDLSFETRCPGAASGASGELRINVPGRRLKAFTVPEHLTYPDWGSTQNGLPVGQIGDPKTITITGASLASVTLGQLAMAGTFPDDWLISNDTCSGVTLAQGDDCTFTMTFIPVHQGWRDAEILIPSDSTLGTRRVPVRAVAKAITTTTIELIQNPVFQPQEPVARITVSPDPGGGLACVHDPAANDAYTCLPMGPGGVTDVPFSSSSDNASVTGYFGATDFYAGSQSAPVTLHIGISSKVTLTSALNPQESTKPVALTASVAHYDGSGGITGGTLSITDTTSGVVLGSKDVSTGTTLTISTTLSVGSHAIVAAYSGQASPVLAGSASAQLTQIVVADKKVDVSGVAISRSTFYPVVDSFKDTVTVSGRLGEVARVSIKVVSVATGRTVRSLALGMKPIGSYSWSWNGRTSGGTLQASGKYKIIQTIADMPGNKVTATNVISLSRRRVTWRTVTYTKSAASFSASGIGSAGMIVKSASSYAGGVRMYASIGDWAATAYSFKLPTAPGYKTITFRVTGRTVAGDRAWIGVWAPARGSYTNINSYDALRRAGTAYATYSAAASGPTHYGSGYARGLLLVTGTETNDCIFDASKVKMTVVYAVWAN